MKFFTRNKSVVWVLIFVITVIWGYSWVMMKVSLAYMGPFTFSAFRFGTGAITLFISILLFKMKRPPKKYIKPLIVLGILQTSIVFLLVMYGMQFIGAGKASILLYSMPIWSTLLAVKFLREHVTPWQVAGNILGLVGLLAILGADLWAGQNLRSIFGELLIVLAAVSWGASNVYYRVKLEELPRLVVTAYQMLFGTIGITLVAFIMEWGEPVKFTGTSLFLILFTGILASALCFSLWFLILSLIDMVTATISTMLVPVFGLFLGWLYLDEKLTLGTITGSVLIIAGIVIAQMMKKGERKRSVA